MQNGTTEKPNRELRHDSKFKPLTEEQREDVIRWCAQEGYRGALVRIKEEFGITAHISSLKNFTRWYHRNKGTTQFRELIEFGKSELDIDQQELRHQLFSEMKRKAIMSGDNGLLLAVLKEEGKDQERALAERRVIVLEKTAQRAKEAIEGLRTDGGLTPDTLRKIEEAARLL